MFPSKPYCFALVCPALLLPSLLLLLLLLWSGLPCFALLISLSDSRSLFALCCFVLLRFAFASLCLLFCLFGCSWPLFGPSWPVLGRSWALLGRSWPLLGRSWAALGRSKTIKKSIQVRPPKKDIQKITLEERKRQSSTGRPWPWPRNTHAQMRSFHAPSVALAE